MADPFARLAGLIRGVTVRQPWSIMLIGLDIDLNTEVFERAMREYTNSLQRFVMLSGCEATPLDDDCRPDAIVEAGQQ